MRARRVSTGALLALLSLVGACDDTTLGRFSVDEALPESRVAGGGLITLLPDQLDPFTVDLTDSEAFEQQDYDYLTFVRLDALSFEISASSEDPDEDPAENGMPDDFDFLNSIELFVAATIDDVERRALIASLPQGDIQLTDSRQRIELLTTGVDILDFVEADGGYRIESRVSGSAPADTVIFGGESSYRIGIGFR